MQKFIVRDFFIMSFLHIPLPVAVYVTTAANARESSYACYFDSHLETYLGDVYSIKWMENVDQVGLVCVCVCRCVCVCVCVCVCLCVLCVCAHACMCDCMLTVLYLTGRDTHRES